MDEDPTEDPKDVSPKARQRQMAEGLYKRYVDIVKTLERRESFVWQLEGEDPGDVAQIADRTGDDQ